MKIPSRDAFARFFSKVSIPYQGLTGPCWPWEGAKVKCRDGIFYGSFFHHGKTAGAHRASWELYNETPIPKGMTIDHLCNNTICVNPYHLEVATQWENNSRGNSACAKNARKTTCSKGHLYLPENVKKATNGKRCRRCANDQQRGNRGKRNLESVLKNREYTRLYCRRVRAEARALREREKIS